MNSFQPSELAVIARIQKRILLLLLVSIPIAIIFLPGVPVAIPEIPGIAVLALIGITAAALLYRLAKALHSPAPWIYVPLAFIPYINTLTLLTLNFRATRTLKQNGYEIGLMGALPPESRR